MYKFYILQSLKPEESYLGKQVFNNIKDLAPSYFCEIQNEKNLFDTLELIRQDLMINLSKQGIIHIHCHGNENGIVLYENSSIQKLINWSDIRPYFRNIYISTSKRTIISVCSCEGFNAGRLVAHFEPCPFDYVTGSMKEVGFEDSVNGYTYFYKSLISGKTVREGTIETTAKFIDMDFVCLNSIQLFKAACEELMKFSSFPGNLKQKREVMKQKIINDFGYINEKQKNIIDQGYSEEGVKTYIERYKEIFLS